MQQKPLEMGQRSRFPLETLGPRAIFLGFISAVAGRRSAEPSRFAGQRREADAEPCKAARCSGRKGDGGPGTPGEGGHPTVGSREKLSSPLCLTLPKKDGPREHRFPSWSFTLRQSHPSCAAASWCPGQSPPRGLPPHSIPRSIWH